MTIKLRKGEVQERIEDPLTLFFDGIRAKTTKEKYTRRLKTFLCVTLEDYLDGDLELREKQRKERLEQGNKKEIKSFLDADFSQRAKEFVEKSIKNTKWAESILITYSAQLKKRTELPKNHPDRLSPNYIPKLFQPIQKLFDMNGVPFTWKKIRATFPEAETDDDTRGYEREEINTALKYGQPIDQMVMLIASSSAIRRGGFDFTWNSLHPVYKKNGELIIGNFNDENYENLVCAMIRVYKNSNESYFALITPESWNSIINYKNLWKQEVGQDPKPDHMFLKKAGDLVRPLSSDAAANRLAKVLRRAGIRTALLEGQKHQVPLMNGFRRYYDKITSEILTSNSTLGDLIRRERLMGHTGLIPLDKNYFKTHWKELVEEYLELVPAITISSEERVKAEIQLVRKEKNKLESEKDKLLNEVSETNKKLKETDEKVEFILKHYKFDN